MELVHNGRKYKIYSNEPIPKRKNNFTGYFYICKFLDEKNIYKIGFTNNIIRRLTQECKTYNINKVEIIFMSPLWRETTARRVEHEVREQLKEKYEYIPKDRFILPPNEKINFSFKVRNVYSVIEH